MIRLAGIAERFHIVGESLLTDLHQMINLVDVDVGRTVLLGIEQRKTVMGLVKDDQLAHIRDEVVRLARVKQRRAMGQFTRFTRSERIDHRVDVEILRVADRRCKERDSENPGGGRTECADSVGCHECLSFWLDASQEEAQPARPVRLERAGFGSKELEERGVGGD